MSIVENMRECRVCMTSSEELLIQPCSCITSYIHESCLQQWRSYNINNDNYEKCEVCQTKYVILWQHRIETFIIKFTIGNCPVFCMYPLVLIMGSMIVSLFDLSVNQASLFLLNGGNHTTIMRDFDSLAWVIYYVNYTTYIYCMLFFVYLYVGVKMRIHRKEIYFEKTKYAYLGSFLLSWSYFYNYYIFYKFIGIFQIYTMVSFAMIIINCLIIISCAYIHNNTVREMNTDNTETIISIRYNPLNFA